jgi:hypothetical protein
MRRFLSEMLWLLCLVWRPRRAGAGRVSDYARVSIAATELVEVLRLRYPGRDFFWSFVTEHGNYEGKPTAVRLVLKGPVALMTRKVEKGCIDGKYERQQRGETS